MSNENSFSLSLKRESSFSTTNSLNSDMNSDFQINIKFEQSPKKLKRLTRTKTRFYYDAIDINSEFTSDIHYSEKRDLNGEIEG